MNRPSIVTVPRLAALLLLTVPAVVGCGDDVSSTDDARKAYLGLDASIDKAITLGFAGFNSATSANIAEQTASGARAGTIKVAGQVDQGASDNKGMRLKVAMAAYSDDGALTYDTAPASLPALEMQLKSIPNGTLSGTLVGPFTMSGTLHGTVTLNLSFSGQLQPNATDASKVERKPGTTHITGTATSPAGTYAVDITR